MSGKNNNTYGSARTTPALPDYHKINEGGNSTAPRPTPTYYQTSTPKN